ncbi:dynamin, partial [Helicosporidium sp. ATCC 50920]
RRDELRALGEAAPGPTGAARGAALLTLLDAYARRFGEMLDGRGEHLPVDQLAGGARLRHVFHDIFRGGLEALDPGAQLSDDDVRTAIRNSGGVKGALLIPEAPFELLVRRAIERLLPPALQAKEYVHAELLRVAAQCAPLELQRFPVLQSLLAEAVEAFVAQGAAPAEAMIRNLVSCELALINTSHPAFVGGNRAIAQVLERRAAEEDRKVPGRGPGGRGGAAGNGGGALAGGQPISANPGTQTGPLRAGARASETPVSAPRESSAEEGARGEGPADARAPNPLLSPLERPGLAGLTSEGAGGRPGWFRGWFAGRSESSEAGEPGPSLRSSDAEARSIYGLGERFAAALSTGPGGGGSGGLPRPPAQLRVPGQASDQEGVQVEVTRLLVSSYFDVVRKNLQDMVPKALMLFMVGHVQRDLQQHLIRSLYREELFAELMTERQDVASKRSHCQRALKALRAALGTLEALPQELSGGGGSRGSSRGASLLKEGASRARREALAADPMPGPQAVRLALPPAQERFGGAGDVSGPVPDSPTGAGPWDLPQTDQRVRGRIAAVR